MYFHHQPALSAASSPRQLYLALSFVRRLTISGGTRIVTRPDSRLIGIGARVNQEPDDIHVSLARRDCGCQRRRASLFTSLPRFSRSDQSDVIFMYRSIERRSAPFCNSLRTSSTRPASAARINGVPISLRFCLGVFDATLERGRTVVLLTMTVKNSKTTTTFISFD